MMKLTTAFLALSLSAGAVLADEVTDTLAAAQESYASGNLNNTAAQITAALPRVGARADDRSRATVRGG